MAQNLMVPSRLKEYVCTGLSADIVFDDDAPSGDSYARQIVIVTAGNGKLHVEFQDGHDEALTSLKEGEEILGKFAKIIDDGDTDCARIRAGW